MLLLQVGTSALSCSVPAKLSAEVLDLPAAGAIRQASCGLAQTGGVPALRSASHSILPSAADGQANHCTAHAAAAGLCLLSQQSQICLLLPLQVGKRLNVRRERRHVLDVQRAAAAEALRREEEQFDHIKHEFELDNAGIRSGLVLS